MTPALLVIAWLLITLSLWCFAFWHIPEATPDWLLRAQAACFGINENGLPDTYGWMILALAPLSLLIALIVVYGAEIPAGLKRFVAPVSGRVFAVTLAVVFVAEVLWVSRRIGEGIEVAQASYQPESTGELPPHYPRTDLPAKDFSLLDQQGEIIDLAALRGRPFFLTFAFAHCQTVCPAIVEQVLTAARQFPPQTLGVVIVTLDPWRDTPGSLPGLAKTWRLRGDEHVLSGSVDSVLAVHADYKMSIQRDERSGDVVHPSLTYLIDEQGRIAYMFSNVSSSWLAQAARRIVDASSGQSP